MCDDVTCADVSIHDECDVEISHALSSNCGGTYGCDVDVRDVDVGVDVDVYVDVDADVDDVVAGRGKRATVRGEGEGELCVDPAGEEGVDLDVGMLLPT